MAAGRHCKGETRAGSRCRARPQRDKDYCRAHDPDLEDGERFGSPEQAAAAGGGRPRKPSPTRLLRERVEGDIEQLLGPYLDALVAMDGDRPDHATRMRAAREVFDRVYGRPRKEGDPAPDEEEESPGMTSKWDLRRLTDDELETLRELAVKAGATS